MTEISIEPIEVTEDAVPTSDNPYDVYLLDAPHYEEVPEWKWPEFLTVGAVAFFLGVLIYNMGVSA